MARTARDNNNQGKNERLSDEAIRRFEDGAPAFFTYIGVNRNLSPNTSRAYDADLREFTAWLRGDPLQSAALLRDLPGRFVSWLSASGDTGRTIARTTIARKASALKSFFRFLMKEGYFAENTLPLIFHSPKLPKRLPDFLTEEDVNRLRACVTEVSEEHLLARNAAMLEVLFTSGIRVAELVGLDFGDIQWEEGELRIMGKGSRERIAFVSNNALQSLAAYRKQWPVLAKDKKPLPNHAVFLNYQGTRLDVRSVRRFLKALGEAAELSRPLHPHLFRHTFATHLLNKGVDLRVVQELLGHVSIRSTQVYTHLTTDRLRKAYLSAHPRAGH